MQVDVSEENENAEEEAYIVENPTLVRTFPNHIFFPGVRSFCMTAFFLSKDLETYAGSYRGMAKLMRLMYIADHCPSLRIESLKMAITSVQETYNVTLYQQLHRKLQEAIVG